MSKLINVSKQQQKNEGEKTARQQSFQETNKAYRTTYKYT